MRPREPIEHGTVSGYAKHRRRGIKLCDPCRLAWNQYVRDYNKNRGNR